MPRLIKIKNPFARKSKNLEGMYANNAKDASKAEDYAITAAKLLGKYKRLLKKINAKYKKMQKDKKAKDIKELNALIGKANDISHEINGILGTEEEHGLVTHGIYDLYYIDSEGNFTEKQ